MCYFMRSDHFHPFSSFNEESMDDVAMGSQVRFVLYVNTMRTDYSQHGRCWIWKLYMEVDLICVIPISIVFRKESRLFIPNDKRKRCQHGACGSKMDVEGKVIFS